MTRVQTQLRLAGGLHGLSRLLDVLRRFAESHAVPVDAQRDALVALEEIVTNVLRHGGDGSRVPGVDVSIAVEPGSLVMTVVDDGVAFDPLTAIAPSIDTALPDRPIGGLGILLVRRLMDRVDYTRTGDLNELTLIKRFEIES